MAIEAETRPIRAEGKAANPREEVKETGHEWRSSLQHGHTPASSRVQLGGGLSALMHGVFSVMCMHPRQPQTTQRGEVGSGVSGVTG